MDIYYSLDYWLFIPQVWLIVGIILIASELLDGSAIFFLPFGIAAVLLALVIHLVDTERLSYEFLATTWYLLLVQWAVIASVLSAAIAFWRRSRALSGKDINDY